MAKKSDDSRPFLDLTQKADDFQTGFVTDIKSCLNTLHAKLTALVLEPDCVDSKNAAKISAHLEFTKAKYEIFMGTKSLFESLEKSWNEQLIEMKNSFLENVEILLASMKLSQPDRESSTKSKNVKKSNSSSTCSSIASSSLFDTAKNTPVVSASLRKNISKGRKSILKPEPLNESELHATPSRSTRKRTAGKETNVNKDGIPEIDMERSESNIEFVHDSPKTPKNVHFSVGYDVNEDLEIYSPEVNITKSAPKRKTVVSNDLDTFSDINLTPNVGRSKSKRKTICGSMMDVTAAPSSKRLKRGTSIIPSIAEEPEKMDLLDESTRAEHYTPWLLLGDLDGKIPSQPGVYELKVYKAKKSAYVGSCDSLRQKLTLYKIGQNSGHKQLDKFLERNRKDVQVRFEEFPSAAQAKKEEMLRVKAFVEQHKTTPAYN